MQMGSHFKNLEETILNISIGECLVIEWLCTPILKGLDFITKFKLICNTNTLTKKDKERKNKNIYIKNLDSKKKKNTDVRNDQQIKNISY